MASELPFRTLRPWLIETFGRPVHRVALDAGSQCPNRDGSKGFGGALRNIAIASRMITMKLKNPATGMLSRKNSP